MAESKRPTVAVISSDSMLFRKIELELLDVCDCTPTDTKDADIRLIDLDSPLDGEHTGLTMSRTEECDISLPFILGSLKERLFPKDGAKIQLEDSGRVIIGAKEVRLTEVELSLFKALYLRGGDYATRDELIREVWGEISDGGVLNVYVHYLRQKLEGEGERIIIATRGKGYRINEAYIGGGV